MDSLSYIFILGIGTSHRDSMNFVILSDRTCSWMYIFAVYKSVDVQIRKIDFKQSKRLRID